METNENEFFKNLQGVPIAKEVEYVNANELACLDDEPKTYAELTQPQICDEPAKTFPSEEEILKLQAPKLCLGDFPTGIVHTCEICDKVFKYYHLLKRHKNVHVIKTYQCDVCKKTFENGSNLRTHKRIHTGAKPYECDVCDKSFNVSTALTRHKRTHTCVKPHKCDKCGLCFNETGNLKVHIKRYHENNSSNIEKSDTNKKLNMVTQSDGDKQLPSNNTCQISPLPKSTVKDKIKLNCREKSKLSAKLNIKENFAQSTSLLETSRLKSNEIKNKSRKLKPKKFVEDSSIIISSETLNSVNNVELKSTKSNITEDVEISEQIIQCSEPLNNVIVKKSPAFIDHLEEDVNVTSNSKDPLILESKECDMVQNNILNKECKENNIVTSDENTKINSYKNIKTRNKVCQKHKAKLKSGKELNSRKKLKAKLRKTFNSSRTLKNNFWRAYKQNDINKNVILQNNNDYTMCTIIQLTKVTKSNDHKFINNESRIINNVSDKVS